MSCHASQQLPEKLLLLTQIRIALIFGELYGAGVIIGEMVLPAHNRFVGISCVHQQNVVGGTHTVMEGVDGVESANTINLFVR